MAGEEENRKKTGRALLDKEAYRNNYWRLGFRSRLYDLFTPRAYTESLSRAAALVPDAGLCLDAGCGSGQLIPLLARRGEGCPLYLGADKLVEGLARARERAGRACFLRWDLTAETPFAAASIDVVVAHFSIYTLDDPPARLMAWRNLFELTRPGGQLIAANPSTHYSAETIIEHSLNSEQVQRGPLIAWLKRVFIAPITRHLGLAYIQRQLEEGGFHAYTPETFSAEVESAGWRVKAVEPVYAGSGILLTARRP